jgi:hypothetical protein
MTTRAQLHLIREAISNSSGHPVSVAYIYTHACSKSWIGGAGQGHSPRAAKWAEKSFKQKNVFSACSNFILLNQIRGNSINNCDF